MNTVDLLQPRTRSNKQRLLLVALIAWVAMQSPQVHSAERSPSTQPESLVGRRITNFVIPDVRGELVGLADYNEHRAVVLFFMSTHCPIANLYLNQLAELQEQYAAQGLQLLGIHSNHGVTRQEIAEHSEEFKIAWPVLHDADQRVAELLGATRTAEVFLLDRQRDVRYHGRIDDRFGYTYKNEKARREDLKIAVDELLTGKDISLPETKPAGCLITRSHRDTIESDVTYAKDVSRIIQRRCHECHRPGMVGPFSLLKYDDAVEWSAMMKEVVMQRRMPPWHADPRWGHWSNNRKMPQQEVDTLIAWIDAGTPFGQKEDLPPPRKYSEGWVIDEPDLVFELPEEVSVPADGVVPYLYFTVPTNFKEDVYIQAAEARPGNRAVVHHIIVNYRLPNSKSSRWDGGVCGTAPGDPPLVLPPGVAKKIPAGAELVFQMHYTPTGKLERDRSQLGLVLYKGEMPPRGLARSKGVLNHRFEIPPGADSHEVRSNYTFNRDVTLLSLMPHMHLRGKDFLFRATYPDGRNETLLSVPAYDFNWQNTYRFEKPLAIPEGTRIDCVAHFDNSAGNPANPDPTEKVRWGDQTWEEMMIGWVSYMVEENEPEPDTR